MADLIPGLGALLGLDQFGGPVTLDQKVTGWRKRLKPGSYKSPSGKTVNYQFVDLSREFELRGTPWEFPQVNDAYVQKKGFGPRKYPMVCYFSGDNCDLLASAFESALCEPGQGFLHHPLYGSLNNVVPFGTVKRTDAVTTAGNQTIVEVTFWTTTGAVYPNSDPSSVDEIASALKGFDLAAAQGRRYGREHPGAASSHGARRGLPGPDVVRAESRTIHRARPRPHHHRLVRRALRRRRRD